MPKREELHEGGDQGQRTNVTVNCEIVADTPAGHPFARFLYRAETFNQSLLGLAEINRGVEMMIGHHVKQGFVAAKAHGFDVPELDEEKPEAKE